MAHLKALDYTLGPCECRLDPAKDTDAGIDLCSEATGKGESHDCVIHGEGEDRDCPKC